MRWITVTLIGLIGISQTAYCQPEQLTVDALIERAVSENAELRYYTAALAAARGQRTQAGLWKNPELEGEYANRRVKGGGESQEGFARGIKLTQTFEFPGKGSLRKAIADKDVEVASLALDQFRLTLENRVRHLAYQVMAARNNIQLAEEIAERSQDLVKLLRERPQSGTTNLIELRIIETSLFEIQKSVKEFKSTEEEARIELNHLTGLPSSFIFQIQGQIPEPGVSVENEDVVLRGLEGNLQLKIREKELLKAAKEVSSARMEPLPDFSVGPFFSQDKAGENEENIGATVAVTLPLWDWNQGNIATAKARREQADALLLDARRKVEGEILRRLRQYTLARDLHRQMSPQDLSKLRNTADLADRQYRLGAIEIQLYLEMQRELLSVQHSLNQLNIEAWESLFDLNLLTGGAFPVLPTNREISHE